MLKPLSDWKTHYYSLVWIVANEIRINNDNNEGIQKSQYQLIAISMFHLAEGGISFVRVGFTILILQSLNMTCANTLRVLRFLKVVEISSETG